MSLRSASTLLLAASCAIGPLLSTSMLHAAALPNRLSREAAGTAPQAMAQGVSPRLRTSTALGHLDGDTRLDTMSLVLTPSADQSAALDQLLADQQNPASPRYHQWLTPAEFGAQFGVSDGDLKILQNWLTNQGLQVLDIAPSRNRITFSGTSRTVEAAFHTEFTNYSRNGQKFFENSTAPQIPAALQNVVGAITGLSSYRLHPAVRKVLTNDSARISPQHPDSTAASGSHYVTPWDFRQIYDANGLFNSGQTGTGIKIAVLGQSSIDLNQIADFQTLTGQSQKAPTLVLLPNSGVSTAYPGDELESESDVEYSSGVAPGATISFIYSGSSTSVGVTDALNYAITNNVAPILTYSYGGCETENTLSALTGQEGYFRQANAQGQTILVAAGDTGAAGCEDPGVTTAYDGLQVGYPASSPYVTAVGGTQFNDSTGNYWSTSNNSQDGSALGYIPESVWNENSSDPLAASGGGASHVFGKPSWQTGTGVPADGARDIPDISFTAAEHDAYLVCTSDTSYTSTSSSGVVTSGACTSTAFGIAKVGGTSLPTPAFSGALAMILNANNASAGLGNINPLLYNLAGTVPSVFHDVTSGNNIDPCASGTLGCVNGSEGYSAGTGYDLATGLGSLDIGALSTNLSVARTATSGAPTLALTVTSASTSAITVAVRASSNTTTTVPTGNVTVALDGGTPQTVALASSTSYGSVANATFTGTFATGAHTITAAYAGDATFRAATASTTLNVSTTGGGLTLAATPTTVTINSSTAHSGTWSLTLTSTNGYTGIVGYNVAAASGSSEPTSGCFFGQGDAGLSANATVTTAITFSYSASDCSNSNVIKAFGSTRKAVSQAAPAIPGNPRNPYHLPLLAIGFTGLLGSAFTRRRRAWMTGLLALAAMAGTAGLSGCGSGSAPLSTSTTGGSGSGTTSVAPKGTYNLVFTASDYLNNTPTSSVNVTLVIQ